MTAATGVTEAANPLIKGLQKVRRAESSGVLEVTGQGVVVRLHFRGGGLVHAERMAGEEVWPLGEYLTHSGVLRPQRVLKALRVAEAKGRPVEEVLVAQKGVTEDLVRRFTQLQLEEIVFPLFRIESPSVRWLEERPAVPSMVTPLPAEWLLKEGRRRRGLWPRIRENVGRSNAVYAHEPGLLSELLGYTYDRKDPLPSIGGNARVVTFYSDGRRTVLQVARASGLGVFQVYQAMDELLDLDVMELVAASGTGDEPRAYRPYLRALLLGVSYLIFGALFFLGGRWVMNHGEELRRQLFATVSMTEATSPDQRRSRQMARLHEAMKLHELEFGHYPASIDELLEAGYALEGRALLKRALTIELETDGYRLVPKGESSEGESIGTE